MTGRVRVGLVADSLVVVEGLHHVLKADNDIDVAWDSLALDVDTKVQILIVASQDGETLEKIGLRPEPKIVLGTNLRSLNSANTTWLLPSATGLELRQAVRKFANRLLSDYELPGHSLSLTDREQQVLNFLASGISPSQAAQRMHISRNTMKTHLRRVYQKLRVNNRTEAVLEGLRLGLASTAEARRANRATCPRGSGLLVGLMLK